MTKRAATGSASSTVGKVARKALKAMALASMVSSASAVDSYFGKPYLISLITNDVLFRLLRRRRLILVTR